VLLDGNRRASLGEICARVAFQKSAEHDYAVGRLWFMAYFSVSLRSGRLQASAVRDFLLVTNSIRKGFHSSLANIFQKSRPERIGKFSTL
jgi:hypothetical protein